MLPFVEIRLLVAITALSIGVVLDLFNKKNIPDSIAWTLLLFSVVVALITDVNDLFLYGVLQAVFIMAIGYLLYKKGVIGLADPIFFSIIALLFPMLPDNIIPLPFIMPTLLYSGVIFGTFTAIYFGVKVIRTGITQPDWKNLLIMLVFIGFAYLYRQYTIYNPVFLYMLFLLSLSAAVIGIISKDIKRLMVSNVAIDLAEEEVLADELDMKISAIAKGKKVVDKQLINKLKAAGVHTIPVYAGMLPYLPFLAAGFLMSYLWSSLLLF